jgi:hypothetical protein
MRPAFVISISLKAITAALADPRKADANAAEQLIASGRPIYYFNAALHSDETGSTETTLELAYRLAVSEQPQIQRIRENLVVLINPVSNPDGRDKQVEWFYRYLKGKTVLEHLPRQAPPYWSKVRLRRHQPRCPPTGSRDHGGLPDVLRLASHCHSRSARE